MGVPEIPNNSYYSQAKNLLESVPTFSSTDLNLEKIIKPIFDETAGNFNTSRGIDKQFNGDTIAIFTGDSYVPSFSFQSFAVSITRAFLTYALISATYHISFVANGLVGMGKIAFAAIDLSTTETGTEEYKKAQDSLEKGFFHITTGVYDFAVGRVSWITSLLSFGFGCAPTLFTSLHKKAWQPLTETIKHGADATQEKMQLDREGYSLCQGVADLFQEAITPTGNRSRGKAAIEVAKRIAQLFIGGNSKEATDISGK